MPDIGCCRGQEQHGERPAARNAGKVWTRCFHGAHCKWENGVVVGRRPCPNFTATVGQSVAAILGHCLFGSAFAFAEGGVLSTRFFGLDWTTFIRCFVMSPHTRHVFCCTYAFDPLLLNLTHTSHLG